MHFRNFVRVNLRLGYVALSHHASRQQIQFMPVGQKPSLLPNHFSQISDIIGRHTAPTAQSGQLLSRIWRESWLIGNETDA